MPSAAARKGRHGASYRKHVDADPTWLGRCCLPYTPLPSRRNYDPGASGPPRGLWPHPPEPARNRGRKTGGPPSRRRPEGTHGCTQTEQNGRAPLRGPGPGGAGDAAPRVTLPRSTEKGKRSRLGAEARCRRHRLVPEPSDGRRQRENGACGVGGNSPRTRFQFGGGIFLGGRWRVHSREMVKAHEPSTEKWFRRYILRYVYLTVKSDQKTKP